MITKETVRERRRRWWKLPLVWIDPVRGYVSAWFLSITFEAAPHATSFERSLILLATATLLFGVLWMQTRGRVHAGETISPSSFLGGMMLALLPPVVAYAAIAIGVATAIAMKNFAAGYLVAATTTLAIGYLFLDRSPYLAVYTLLVAAPLIINWLRRTALVMPVRC